MKSSLLTFVFILLTTAVVAEDTPADAKIRNAIPLGGDFLPNPTVGAFVVVGHGARILVSASYHPKRAHSLQSLEGSALS